MEIISRRQTFRTTGQEQTTETSETQLSDVRGPLATVLALALAGGVALTGYDLRCVTDRMLYSGKVDISASAAVQEAKSPVRRLLNFDELGRLARELAGIDIQASAEQMHFEWQDITGEDLLTLVYEANGTAIVERDPESGVIDSITASFYQPLSEGIVGSIQAAATPKKLVGDLAQTSITTANGQEQVIGLAEWTISWKRKTVESTTTDDSIYEGALPSTKSWTVKAKYMFVDGDQSQIDAVLSAIDTPSLDPLPWNFFPTIESGRAAFSGLAFVDSIDIGSGSGKIVGLDVSLKGTGPLKRLVQVAPVANTNTVTGQQAEV